MTRLSDIDLDGLHHFGSLRINRSKAKPIPSDVVLGGQCVQVLVFRVKLNPRIRRGNVGIDVEAKFQISRVAILLVVEGVFGY